MTYVSLHTHSVFSILDGLSTIPDLVSRAVELGMPALGISDHGNLHGAHQLWKECGKYEIKPIIGMEAYVAPGMRQDKSVVVWGELEGKKVPSQGNTHLTLIAKNARGLRNLYKLHELSYTEGFHHKPRIDLAALQQHRDGIIVLTGCAGGELATRLRLGQMEEARSYLRKMKETFPDLYLEVMYHGLDFDLDLNSQLIEMAEEHKLQVVATNDSHYTREDDVETHAALLCVGTGSRLDDDKRFKFNGSGYWLRSYEEMLELPLPRVALDNTLVVADMVSSYDEVFAKRNLMPKWEGGGSLREIATKALDTYNLGEEYSVRLDHELGVIEQAGFDSYFLMVRDLVSWSKSHGIRVGPGRGSAAGSLVSYVLEITEVDPIRHALVFSRFLNPARLSVPDIDLDIEDERRDEVIAYAVEKYGADKVAQIVTFGTIKAKAAIKDANRVMGGAYSEGERLVGLIPEAVFGREHGLKGLTKLEKANPEVYELASGLEGLVRSTGKHAAGIVVSPEPLSDIIPVSQDRITGMLITGYDQHVLEDLGLVKLDLLGLQNLTIIQKCLDNLGDDAPDLKSLPLDDQPTYELLASGDTLGVFQLDGQAMQRVLKKVKPTKFEDIASVLALWRPGAMTHVDEFARRKNEPRR